MILEVGGALLADVSALLRYSTVHYSPLPAPTQAKVRGGHLSQIPTPNVTREHFHSDCYHVLYLLPSQAHALSSERREPCFLSLLWDYRHPDQASVSDQTKIVGSLPP